MDRISLVVLTASAMLAWGMASAAVGDDGRQRESAEAATGSVALSPGHDVSPVGNAPAGPRKGGPRMTAKPTAPIDVRWLSAGEDGTVSLQIVSGVDHVGATLRVTGPGLGRPLTMQLPAAVAGEVQTAEWSVSRSPRQPLRAVVVIDTGDRTMARTAVAGSSQGKPVYQVSPVGPQAGADADGGALHGDRSTEVLVELPGEQTVRRKGE